MEKASRNDRCPCGSGKKYKKCCWTSGGLAASFTPQERLSALAKLERFIDDLGDEEDLAWEEFWGQHLDRGDELDEHYQVLSIDVFDMWFRFDRLLADDLSIVDALLAEDTTLTPAERLYLRIAAGTTMRLYEVVALSPGVSLTLRDVLDGTQVTVQERLGSRSSSRFDWLAARILPHGVSGTPELEAGLLHIPRLIEHQVAAQLSAHREAFRREVPEANDVAFYKAMPPFFHDAWLCAILEPHIPQVQNTDGEDMVPTRVRFEVLDPSGLRCTLDSVAVLEREGTSVWRWWGKNQKDQSTLFGRLVLDGESLVLETNSVQRGEHGRMMVERLANATVRHQTTTHENLERSLREQLRSPCQNDAGKRPGPDAIPPEVADALTLNYLGRHYRKWLDESIPALEDRTPREAVKDARLRPKLVDLIHQLEGMYEAALKRGEPAYDPSWMWSELGLEDRSTQHPPPLAHERMAQMVPGFGETYRTVAEHLRRKPGFKHTSTILTSSAFQTNLEIQRFLRELRRAPGESNALGSQAQEPGWVASHLRHTVNLELHRRKTFWVDESLAYMLGHTDLDVLGRELRVPFPSFALVFTDRHVLSLAERMLAADRTSPLAGHLLHVATIYVTEVHEGSGRELEIAFALDALGADPPHLVVHTIPLADETPVALHIDGLAPRVTVEPPVPDSNPLRGLLQVTINAILYATSADVEPEVRRNPDNASSRVHGRSGPERTYSSEEVYYLPGAIEISRVRRMQELERVPDGRQLLRRFMVRGHWRRAAPTWKDQRMRWIEPYWKGPDMAAIVEQTYRLVP